MSAHPTPAGSEEASLTERTEAEVLAFIREAMPPEYDFREADYEATKTSTGGWRLKVSQMYDYVPMNAGVLFRICEFFNTFNVNDDRYHTSGCETCDYGSSYEVTLRVEPGKPFARAPSSSTPGSPA